MVRRVAGKVAWAARATTTVVGLAIMLALVVGAATTALGANGDLFRLGSAKNVATRATTLVGKAADGAALVVDNPSGGPALRLQAAEGQAPLEVDSGAEVANLHAARATDSDTLDGRDSADFAPRSAEAWRELENWPAGGPGGTLNAYGCCGNMSSWVNHSPSDKAAYYKDPYGVVHLKGRVRWNLEGPSSDNRWWSYRIMNLPQGYRPSGDRIFAVVSNNQPAAITVEASGGVGPTAQLGDGKQWISLDGISFRAAN